jgi:alanine dehydrogenase
VAGADLVVGAINLPGAHTAKLLTRDDVASMGPGAVLMEVCIDGGGISETAHETSHSHPTYVDAGVTHYAVGNMPAAVPRSASLALASAALPRIMNLANLGLAQALRDDAGLLRGLHVHGGAITHPAIGAALRRPAVDLDALLFAC